MTATLQLPLGDGAARPAAGARALDQFYTRRDVARACVAEVAAAIAERGGDWLWIEPSAGQGAFLDLLPEPRLGLDIVSARPDVTATNFLHWSPRIGLSEVGRRIVVIGNPPFGKNASLARAFVNHAAGFADLVAFIVPRTFEKQAFVNRIDRRLHLVSEHPVDDPAFEFEGRPYSVPTLFQIWERRPVLRALATVRTRHPHFDFVTASEADFAFQRVGARAGLVSVEGLCKSAQSHYFIRANGDSDRLFACLASIDWTEVKSRTAGNPSIGKGELILAYEASIDE